MSRIVDAHSHLFPAVWASHGRMPADMFDVAGLLERQEAAGIATTVVSDPHIWYGDLDPGDIARTREYNDFAAELARDHPGQVRALGTASPFRGEEHVREAERALTELGLLRELHQLLDEALALVVGGMRLARDDELHGPLGVREDRLQPLGVAEHEGEPLVRRHATGEADGERVGVEHARDPRRCGAAGMLLDPGRGQAPTRVLDELQAHPPLHRPKLTVGEGGQAHLALIDSEDPLEAGLEIYAQPPGKRLQSLTLLSGGEQALTAIALIFALFLTNPAPICVLDEVDAPLDDANIDRFCDLLDAMVRETETRYLIVTHNAVTMSRMHRLFGVTMVEKGVSRLVSVDLGGAEELLAAE